MATPPRIRGLVDKLERAVRMHCHARKDTKAARKQEVTTAKLELLRAIAIVAGATPPQENDR